MLGIVASRGGEDEQWCKLCFNTSPHALIVDPRQMKRLVQPLPTDPLSYLITLDWKDLCNTSCVTQLWMLGLVFHFITAVFRLGISFASHQGRTGLKYIWETLKTESFWPLVSSPGALSRNINIDLPRIRSIPVHTSLACTIMSLLWLYRSLSNCDSKLKGFPDVLPCISLNPTPLQATVQP